MINKTIDIHLDNGNDVTWSPGSYTDYGYRDNFFIISDGDDTIGIYNLEHIVSIEITETENVND